MTCCECNSRIHFISATGKASYAAKSEASQRVKATTEIFSVFGKLKVQIEEEEEKKLQKCPSPLTSNLFGKIIQTSFWPLWITDCCCWNLMTAAADSSYSLPTLANISVKKNDYRQKLNFIGWTSKKSLKQNQESSTGGWLYRILSCCVLHL